MITLDQFKKMIPTNKEPQAWYDIAVDLFPKYNLNTVNRIAGFMAQAGHESGDFKVTQENLNYSEQNLLKTFPRYFTKATAKQYARKPEDIANHVYNDDNRTSKLGNTEPGDGWKFRGRGLIQVTGRWNYDKFGKSIGKTAEEASVYMETKRGAMESALWYWSSRNINGFADADDIKGMSKAVNGGDIGLVDRIQRYGKNKVAIDALESYPTPINDQITDSVTQAPSTTQIPDSVTTNIQRGSKGDVVRSVQKALKISVDGIYGITTEAAVRSWQRTNRHIVTGKLDSIQIKQLIG